eukprot:9483249-Pyramimonas_sp.AAC.1
MSVAKASKPKKIRAPWRQAGRSLAWVSNAAGHLSMKVARSHRSQTLPQESRSRMDSAGWGVVMLSTFKMRLPK